MPFFFGAINDVSMLTISLESELVDSVLANFGGFSCGIMDRVSIPKRDGV